MREENGEEMESISPSYISPERDQRTHDKDISNKTIKDGGISPLTI